MSASLTSKMSRKVHAVALITGESTTQQRIATHANKVSSGGEQPALIPALHLRYHL